jgi:YihY family inner membrane protein
MLERSMARFDAWQRERAWAALPFAVVKKFGDDQAGNLAALVAYYSFFSIFPLLLVLTTVLGRVLADNPDLQARVLDSALVQLPVIGDQLRDNVDGLPGSGLALVIGIGGALWAGMGAVLGMQTALDGVWNVPLRRRPNALVGRLRALAVLALLGTGVVLLTVSAPLVRTLASVPVVGSLASVGVAFLLALGLFLLTFHVLTDAPVAWRDQLPGAAAAAVAWALLQLVGAAFVRHWVEGAAGASGVFAVVIGLLSWLYLQAQLTVLAAEINVVRREHLWPRSLTGRDLGEGDRRALARYAAVEKRVEGQDVVVDLRPPAVDGFVRTSAAADEVG